MAATCIVRIIKFADDTKIGHEANTDDNYNNMQETINKLVEWADTWGMAFSASINAMLYRWDSITPRDHTA